MELSFVRKRITQLRMQKGVSEYQMSLDLGMSKGYIQSISSGKALPSLKQLANICEYFEITIMEFFDENPDRSTIQLSMLDKMNALDDEDLKAIEHLLDRLILYRNR